MSNWNRRFPFNFRTAVFCFLSGAVISIPISPFLQNWVRQGYLPLSSYLPAAEINAEVYAGCFFALPLWCAIAVRKYPPLPAIGLTIFILMVLFGLLFPAI